jgi:hypothetical protein
MGGILIAFAFFLILRFGIGIYKELKKGKH